MTPTALVTVDDYVQLFLDQPDVALGTMAQLAQAFESGVLAGFPEEFRHAVGQVALSLRPARPVLACAESREAAAWGVEPVLRTIAGSAGPRGYTYAWKLQGEELFPCPYRHDPLLLLPEKSRHEVLAEASRSLDFDYPLALESRTHCPWCRRRYGEALARTGGVWQELTGELSVFPLPADLEPDERDGVCPPERLMGANRGGIVFPLERGADLPEVLRVIQGGGAWPAVTGLVFIPVAHQELAAWQEAGEVAEAVADCWLLEVPEAP